jgi:hypothetical protein
MANMVFGDSYAPCCRVDAGEGCICGTDERVLRGYIGGVSTLQPMTQPQREWCLHEIHSVEGYDREEHESDSDSDLARTVLDAWTDYCRDKGIM